jgi:hypothetical protein
MSRMTRFRPFLLSCVLGLATLAVEAGAEDARPLSPAQVALFETDHLGAIGKAERLQYRYDHAAADGAEAYVDQVNLDVRPRGDGAKDVWVEFLTGKRRVEFPPLSQFRGNPVVMYFLERDVLTMREQTGGAASYFRNRIRHAFVDDAELRQIEVTHGGMTLPATEISLVPFRGDTRIAVFPGLGEKRYRFVLSDAVPGRVYEIEAEVPGAPGQASRVKDTLTFAAEAPCPRSEGPCAAPMP